MHKILLGILILFAGMPAYAGEERGSDYSAIIQTVLDAPQLQKYLHLEDLGDERVPIMIAGLPMLAGKDLCIYKGGERVVLWDMKSNVHREPRKVIRFTQFEVSGNAATVKFTYLVEGLVASMELRKQKSRWVIEDSDLSER